MRRRNACCEMKYADFRDRSIDRSIDRSTAARSISEIGASRCALMSSRTAAKRSRAMSRRSGDRPRPRTARLRTKCAFNAAPASLAVGQLAAVVDGRGEEGSAAASVERVRLLETAHRALAVGRLLEQRLRIPFTSRDAEEVAAVDVDGTGEAGNRVDHRMDHLLSERHGLLLRDRAGAGRLDSGADPVRDAPPEDVVL